MAHGTFALLNVATEKLLREPHSHFLILKQKKKKKVKKRNDVSPLVLCFRLSRTIHLQAPMLNLTPNFEEDITKTTHVPKVQNIATTEKGCVSFLGDKVNKCLVYFDANKHKIVSE